MNAVYSPLLRIIRLFLHEQRKALLLGGLFSAMTIGAGIALLGLSGWFITATAIAGLSMTTAMVFDVFAPSAGIRLLALTRTASRYGERLVTHDATLRVLAMLREKLFRGWAEPGAAKRLARRPAGLLFRLTADIDALDSLYLRVLVPATVAVFAALAVGLFFGLLYPLFGIVAALWLLLAGLGIPVLAARRAMKPARRKAHAAEAFRARVIDLVSGQTDLLMAGRLQFQRDAIDAADRRMAEADNALSRIDAGVAAGFGVASAILLAGTLLAVAALAERGIVGAPVAALCLLVSLAALEPFAGLRRGALELGRTLVAARRVAPRLDGETTPLHKQRPVSGVAFQLDRVTARHEMAQIPALMNISLSLATGESLALIGASGAGKSSLLAVLAGEIDIVAGTVESIPATLLTQRTELFHDSLRANLQLADPAAGDARLWQALEDSGLSAEIRALPKGLDTRLGEGALGLSGGQARRLALARLFLRNTGLWLLDEPTEGLDRETGRDVLRRLAGRANGRTLVIATHIRREAAIADRIAVIEGGTLITIHRRGDRGFEAALDRLRPD